MSGAYLDVFPRRLGSVWNNTHSMTAQRPMMKPCDILIWPYLGVDPHEGGMVPSSRTRLEESVDQTHIEKSATDLFNINFD